MLLAAWKQVWDGKVSGLLAGNEAMLKICMSLYFMVKLGQESRCAGMIIRDRRHFVR